MRTTWRRVMKTKPLSFLLALTFLFLFTSSCSDTLQDGNAATDRGDYKTAHRIYLKLAEDGNVYAQYNLGLQYDRGKGVPQDLKEAVKWYRLAGEQGNVRAQSNLGYMYDNGKGVGSVP